MKSDAAPPDIGGAAVLVSGATGFVGGHLARRLLDEGARLIVLVRRQERARALEERGARLVEGHLRDEVGGPGKAQSAVQVAEDRRFRNLRSDVVLDARQIGMALRRLRRLAQEGGPKELDLEASVDKSAREAGKIELVFPPSRKNRIKLLLLMDVGGSMDPHTELQGRLFSAAHAQSHFRRFESYFFHNCPYARLYDDIALGKGPRTEEILQGIDGSSSILFVGDAWMSPYELTLDGLSQAVDLLRGARNDRPLPLGA